MERISVTKLAAVRGDDDGVRITVGDVEIGVARLGVKCVEEKGVEPEGDVDCSSAMSSASSRTCITSSSAKSSNELVNAVVRTSDFPFLSAYLASTAFDVDSGKTSYSRSTSAV